MIGSASRVCLSRLLTALAAAMLLGGCLPELKSEHPPARVYWLEAVAVSDPPPVAVTVTLVPGLDTDRIWVLEPDQRLNYYAGAFWPERLQLLLQSILERSLESRAGAPHLKVLVERFFAVGDPEAGAPDVDIAARIESGELSCRFESRRRAASERLRDIVAAHQALVDELVRAVAVVARGDVCP
ncbi:MAG: hypothetical protein AB7I04_02035 [Pseudomonadales bacterium]